MQRSTERVLTTHVGSLVRPAPLRDQLRRRASGGAVDEAQYSALLMQSVAEVVAQQAKIGIDIPSDGEYGKAGWTGYVTSRLNGFRARKRQPGDPEPIDPRTAGRDGSRFEEFYKAYEPVQEYDWTGPSFFTEVFKAGEVRAAALVECVGPVSYRDDEVRRDITNFKAALAGKNFVQAFLPVAAPESARGFRLSRFYKDADEFLAAMADALKTEYKAIADAGFLIQLDDALLTHEYDRLLITQSDDEVRKGFEAYIEMLNSALAGIPEEQIRYHVCWGSWNGPHTSDVPLRTVLPLIFKVKAQAYALEAANPRHAHEINVWKDVKLPEGKILIPGVISHSTNVVEHPELVAMRICSFAKLLGRENVIAGTDCGFSQTWSHMRVHPQVQWAKLQALVDGARLATRELWR